MRTRRDPQAGVALDPNDTVELSELLRSSASATTRHDSTNLSAATGPIETNDTSFADAWGV